MHYPTLEQVRAMRGEGNLVPVYREILADMETPVSAFLKVARGRYSFLLESVEGGEHVARYSFIGTEPRKVLRTGLPHVPEAERLYRFIRLTRAGVPLDTTEEPGIPIEDHGAVDPLLLIERELSRYRPVAVEGVPRFHGGAVGYLAYDTAAYFERLPQPAPDPNGLPEAVLMLADTLVVFDHLKHRILVLSHVHLDDEPDPDGDAARYAEATTRIDEIVGRLAQPRGRPTVKDGAAPASEMGSNMTREEYHRAVEKGREYIIAGDVIQVLPSQRLHRRTDAHPFDIYRALRGINPSPYMFYVDLDGFQLVGASPETQVRLEDGVMTVGCIAGTRPRGATPEEDLALERELLADPKERAEHVMLVDLARNDLGRVSQVGGVSVNALMTVERYSHVMHIESNVTGRIRDDRTCFDAFRACSPLGTVSGAPKIRAMEIIAELEPHRRGPYSGAVGYFGFAGNMDTCVALRTLVMKDGVAYAQAGGGVVFDSDPEGEYQETLHKAGALIRAIDAAEAMDLRYGPLQRRDEEATA